MALSSAGIKAAAPGAILWDEDVPGLHVRIGATDSTYTLKYRTRAGHQRRPKIGKVSFMSLTQARDLARKLLARVAAGEDPAGITAIERAAATVAEVRTDYLADDAVRAKKSYAEDKRLAEKCIPAGWANRKAASITADDVKALRKSMSGTPIQFNRLLALLSVMWKFAGLPSPAEGVRRYPERKRRRYMKPDEARAIADALVRHEATAPASVAFIRLLILTGARPKEIAQARWDWLAEGVIHHPDAKTGARDIFLSPAAKDIIESLPRVGDLILGIGKPNKLWGRIRKEAGCPDLRLYDLRHSFASVAVSLGMTLAQIGELLGHATPSTTARYAHLADEHKRKHADATAQAITAYMGV